MDNPHDVDRVLAFAVHGAEQEHTNPHTHVVGQGHVHGLFIMTPHWHDDGGPRGVVGCAERELQRARNCIDAASPTSKPIKRVEQPQVERFMRR